MAFTKVVGPGIHTLAQLRTHNIHSAGIITATKFVGEMESGGGDSTFQNVTVNGNLTVQGDTTTLNTTLRNVELLRVAANSATTAGIITQTGAGDILNLFDGTSEVLTVLDGGNVGIGITNPAEKLEVSGGSIGISGSYKIATHPLVSYSSFVLGGGNYAARLGSTGTSTIRHTQIYAGGVHRATFDGVNNRLGIGITNPATKTQIHGGDATLFVTGNTAVGSAANTGGTVALGGIYHSNGSITGWAQIKGFKDNNTSNNYNGYLSFTTRDTTDGYVERLRITSAGNVLVGKNSVYGSGKAQVHNTAQYCLDVATWSADANGPTIDFYKSRNATPGSNTIVDPDDVIGRLRFMGMDGSNARTAAQITIQSDGNVGVNSMPGRIVFATTPVGGSSSTERLRIKSDGGLRLQKADGNGNFTISRNASVTSTDQPIGVIDFASNTQHTVQARVMGKTRGTSNVGGDLVFETRASGGSLDERVRITGSGAVGINSTTPTANFHLDVNGDLSLGEWKGVSNTYIDQKQDGDLHLINSGRTANGASGSPGTAGVGINRFNNISGGTSLFRDFAVYNGKDSKVLVVDGSASAVGIGTDAPAGTLEIDAASSTQMIMLDSSGTNFARMGYNSASGTAIFDLRSEGHIRFLTNGNSEKLRIDTDGRVMMAGATDNANAHANADDLIIGNTGNDERSGITIVSDTDKDGAIHFSDGTGTGQLRGQIVYGHTFGSLSDVLALYTAGTTSLLIQEDGDVVLGEIGGTRYTENSTSAHLRVVGDASADRPGAISLFGFGNTTNSPHARINFQQQTSGTNGQTTARIEAINRSGAEDASDLVFYTEKAGQDLKECARMTTKGELLINRTDTVSTNLSFDSVHLGIGGNYGPVNSYRTIGFGYRTNETSEYPASIGCQITDWSSNTKAELVFATRDNTAQTGVATERMRIKADGETHFSGPIKIDGAGWQSSTDATVRIQSSTNNDWSLYVDKDDGANASEYGLNIDIHKNATLAFQIRGNGSQTYSIDGAGAVTHNMWSDAPSGFISGGLHKWTQACAEYHYTWGQVGNEDYYIDLTCGSYFQAEFIYTSDQSNGGHLVEQYARGNWANNHTTHRGMMHEWIGGGGNLITTFTVSDQSGNGSVDMRNGMTQPTTGGASYRSYIAGGHEGSSSTANGRLRIAEDKNNVSASIGHRSLIVKVYYGSFSISKSVQ